METLFVGQNIISLKSIDSTNTFLSDLSKHSSIVEGTVVLTEDQLDGRGQQGNVWQSEKNKSLTFSVLLFPKIDVNYQFSFNKCISLSICEAFKRCGVRSQIKWPNDIFINDKKVAGVLIENTIQHEKIYKSVVGVGINVNNDQLDFPLATSLKMETSTTFDLMSLLDLLCEEIERFYLLLKSNKKTISKKYNGNLYRLNMPTTFLKNGCYFRGIVKEVDEYGRLAVETDNGLQYFSWGELRFDFS